jgi:hypothetical protein
MEDDAEYQSSSQDASLALLALLLSGLSFCYWSTTTLSAETPERYHASWPLVGCWQVATLLHSKAKSLFIVNVILDLERKKYLNTN